MSRIPSHTGDMDCPNMAKNMARKSVTVPCRDPATTPRGMLTRRHTRIVQKVSVPVTGRRLARMLATGCL